MVYTSIFTSILCRIFYFPQNNWHDIFFAAHTFVHKTKYFVKHKIKSNCKNLNLRFHLCNYIQDGRSWGRTASAPLGLDVGGWGCYCNNLRPSRNASKNPLKSAIWGGHITNQRIFCNFLKQSRPFSKINMIQSLRDISNVKGVIHKIYRNFPLFVVYCTTSRTWTAFLSPTYYRTIQKNLNNSSFCKQG